MGSDEGRQRRTHLHALIARLRARLQLKRWRLLASETAIQPVIVADNAATMATGQALMAQGLWVGAIRPPTVPAGTARLRITLSAAHSMAQVDQLADALMAIEANA
ncbi:MAG: aminotransferase class I/II-fold pyridoxal phosphate-dependent enzyme [Burkholderiaceae bacterium]